MIKEKAKVNFSGKMDAYMMECGRMENNMVEENLLLKKESREQESGIRARKPSGLPDKYILKLILSNFMAIYIIFFI